MTHSTAEAELVSYCEGLIAGKAAEALVKELTEVQVVEKVIYGDNLAAIALANQTTAASWRTRHVRIRSSLLREALEEPGPAGSGQWKLIHVRGLDLVADGLTKPLLGVAFKRFLENLGMTQPFLQAEDPHVRAAQMRGIRTPEHVYSGGVAAMSLLLGQTLLTEAEALEIKGGRDEADPRWIAAVILVILGAIFAGKLAVQAGRCCVRRLHVWRSTSPNPAGEMRTSSTSSTTMVCNDDVRDSSATPMSFMRQSGLSASSRSMSRSLGLEQSTSSAGPTQSNLDNSKRQAHSKGAACSSGPSAMSGSGGAESSAASGGCGMAVPSAAGGSLASGGSRGYAAEGGIVDVGVKLDLHNPWNLFQHENKGKGWSPQKMAAMHKVWKTNPKRKMP